MKSTSLDNKTDNVAKPKGKAKEDSINGDAIAKLKEYKCNLDPGTKEILLIPFGTGAHVNRYLKEAYSYRTLVELSREEYLRVDISSQFKDRNQRNNAKRTIALSILKQIQDLKGEFVEWKNGAWTQVTDEERIIKQKIQQSLRDAYSNEEKKAKKEEILLQQLGVESQREPQQFVYPHLPITSSQSSLALNQHQPLVVPGVASIHGTFAAANVAATPRHQTTHAAENSALAQVTPETQVGARKSTSFVAPQPGASGKHKNGAANDENSSVSSSVDCEELQL